MIPLTLHIKNFLSYGSPTQIIDFTEHHIICLSGKNGHGKSALLDALVWSIWGQARKVSGVVKPDEHLMRLGQNQMMVMLDFDLGGNRYRIRREYSLTGNKVHTTLDFGLYVPGSGEIRSLTDKTIRATQERINEVIGLDYEACINSIFLRQGQANEFSKKAPKERKDMLASMLGFAHFEHMRKRATELMRGVLTQRDSAMRLLEHARAAAAPQAQLCLERKVLTDQLTELVEQERMIEQQRAKCLEDLDKQRSARAALMARAERYEFCVAQLRQLRARVHELVMHLRMIRKNYKTEKAKAVDRAVDYQKILIHLADCDSALQSRLIVMGKMAVARDAAQTYMHLREREMHRLLADGAQQVALQNAQLLQNRARCLDLETQQQQLEKKLSDYLPYVSPLPDLSHQRAMHRRVNEITERMKMRLLQSRGSLQRLSSTDQIDFSETIDRRCEMCLQPVSPEAANTLCIRRNALRGRLMRRVERLQVIISSAEARAHRLADIQIKHDQYSALREQQHQLLQEYSVYKSRVIADEHVLVELTERAQVVQAMAAQWQVSDAEMARHQNILLGLQHELDALVYDEKLHAQLREQRDCFVAQEQRYAQVLAAYATYGHQRAQLRDLICDIRVAQHEELSLIKARQELELVVAAYTDLMQQQEQLDGALRQIRSEREGVVSACGALDKHIELCIHAEKESAVLEKEVATALEQADEYQLIAQVLSKEGIQALLIEQMIPELEQEANALLAQLTDNQAHLSIESIRDLKQGGTRETLDIKISDAQGVRPYELFSGGEAFRIDFALRIALSKILASRSGRPLQTLIIDEGFGSQDEEGISHIVEAIDRIKNGFAKIFIVSHLPTVKEQFPVHYVVHKGALGSKVSVVEHG